MGILDKLTGKSKEQQDQVNTNGEDQQNETFNDDNDKPNDLDPGNVEQEQQFEIEQLQEDNSNEDQLTGDSKSLENIDVNTETDKEEAEIQEKKSVEKTPVDDIKKIRVNLDGIMKFVDASVGQKGATRLSIFNSKAWLGKLLAEFGTPNPYLTKKPATTPRDIPPTADVAEGMQKLVYDFGLKTDVEKIVYLRDLLEAEINAIEALAISDVKDLRLASIAKTQAYVHACEARFALGNELAILRDKF